ncbi:hypothetical protein LTR95_012287 [Oleoguttula sp. CCFEE 5521]
MPGRMQQPMFGMGHPTPSENQSAARKHFVAAAGEFVGTFLFLFMAFLGHLMTVTTAGDSGPNQTLSASSVVYISLSYGFSLLIAAWMLYRVSGGLFNPAVTLGLVVTGNLPPVRGLVLFPVQVISAMCAAAVVKGIVPGDIAITQTTLNPAMTVAQGFFLEMFLTAQLVFTILILAAEKSKDTFIAPIGIGISLFVIEIAGVYYTGASVNPARSFGPCVASRSFTTYHWIYWFGPFLGALVAAGFYHFLKFMNYEDANPGQDSAGQDEDIGAGQAEQGSRRSGSRNRSGDKERNRGSHEMDRMGSQGRDVERNGNGYGYGAPPRSRDGTGSGAPPRSRGSGRQVDMDGYGGPPRL